MSILRTDPTLNEVGDAKQELQKNKAAGNEQYAVHNYCAKR